MAVFPDHIVLKNTVDDEAETLTQLSAEGVLRPGELCVRRYDGGITLYALDSNGDVASVSGGGGGGGGGGGTNIVLVSGTVKRVTEAQTAAGGVSEYVGIGASGSFVSLTTNINCWISFYPTAADRTADAGRLYGQDPVLGSGVLAEYWVTTSGAVYATPGTLYYNNDTIVEDTIYAAVRDQDGNDVNATVTIKAYGHFQYDGVGLNRLSASGTASGGLLTLTDLGQAGMLVSIESSLAAWVTMYSTDAARTADASRLFADDPVPGDGVLAEWYLDAASEYLITPTVAYCNQDNFGTNAIYLRVRSQAGSPVNATITVKAYTEGTYDAVSGGTYGSG